MSLFIFLFVWFFSGVYAVICLSKADYEKGIDITVKYISVCCLFSLLGIVTFTFYIFCKYNGYVVFSKYKK